MVTSADPRFPIENILDGSTKSFWATTGLYPQEFIITLPTLHVVKKVSIWSSKVAGWTISRSGSDKQFDFDEVYSEDIEDSPDATLQITTFSVSYSDTHRAAAARHLRFTIRRGYSDFCAVHRIAILGEAVPDRDVEESEGKKKRNKKITRVNDNGSDNSSEEDDASERNSRVVNVKERD
ncbi:Heat shock protein beta-11 [Podochytrium sp. JEL0797]|nr:Heat shock protein beta-11 [Podochytrium sp. JEL0797]